MQVARYAATFILLALHHGFECAYLIFLLQRSYLFLLQALLLFCITGHTYYNNDEQKNAAGNYTYPYILARELTLLPGYEQLVLRYLLIFLRCIIFNFQLVVRCCLANACERIFYRQYAVHAPQRFFVFSGRPVHSCQLCIDVHIPIPEIMQLCFL